ncbi:Ribonuclease H-like domain containing protein [Rhypophila decipiens]
MSGKKPWKKAQDSAQALGEAPGQAPGQASGPDLGQDSVLTPTKIEDDTPTSNMAYRAGQRLNEANLPPRLGYAQGPDVALLTNCFPIDVKDNVNIFYYDVKAIRLLSPDELAKRTEKMKLQELEGKKPKPKASGTDSNSNPDEAMGTKLAHILYHAFNTWPDLRDLIGEGKLSSDFRNILVTTKELQESQMSFEIQYKGEKSRYHTDRYHITISKPDTDNKYTMGDLLKHIQGVDYTTEDGNSAKREQVIQALNLFLRHRSKNESLHPYQHPPGPIPTQAVVGSKAYNITTSGTFVDLTGGVEMIQGCFSSIRPVAGRLLVNVNMTFGPFYQHGPLTVVVEAMEQARIPVDKQIALLKGVRVCLTHRDGEMNTEKRVIRVVKAINNILDADWKEVSFTIEEKNKSPKTTTVWTYFRDNYGAKFAPHRDTRQLVVDVGTDERPVYVPIVFCDILAGQSYRAVLEGVQTANMIEDARQDPQGVLKKLRSLGPQLTGLNTQHVDGTRLNTEFHLLNVKGKRLPRPSLRFGTEKGSRQKDKVPQISEKASWNLVGHFRYAEPRAWVKWSMLYLRQGNLPTQDATTPGLNAMTGNVGKRFGQSATCRSGQTLSYTQLPTFMFEYKNELNRCKAKGDKLVLVWLPRKLSAAEYREMKRVSDSEIGILTQLVDSKKAKNGGWKGEQYWDNVLLKINLKLGGVNQIVGMPPASLINFAKTMVVGLDVTHPIPGSGEVPNSTAGMVASVDKSLSQWPGTVYTQADAGAEVKYPKNILVYRDGVSEGQYKAVVDAEFGKMKQVCHNLYSSTENGATPQADPKITIVVVGKRHHMRFYQKSALTEEKEDEINKWNPLPGTLVDRDVTSQFLWEFYLQAHFPIMGVARPAHYVVVADEIFRDMKDTDIKKAEMNHPSDVLYAVTHALSYAVGRSTTATSVCAPAFWADKLCDRAKLFNPSPTKQDDNGNFPPPLKVHPHLADTMFYA